MSKRVRHVVARFPALQYNNRVSVVTRATGVITAFAGTGISGFGGDGGAATSSQLAYPGGIAIDAYGTVFIADSVRQGTRVRSCVWHVQVRTGDAFPHAVSA